MKNLCFPLLLALLLCCGCRSRESDTPRPHITVSIEPLRYVAEQIAGPHFEVSTMVPRGSSPETYEPTSRQLVELSRSRAFFLTGHLGFERNRQEALRANAPQTLFVALSDGIDYIRETGAPSAHADGHTHAGGVEPHVWTSPRNLSVMARNLCDVLCRIDSAHAGEFRSNLHSLELAIAATDDKICTLLQGGQREFLIYHPTLSYFARDYGLVQHAIEVDGKEPSPAHLQQLIDTCRRRHIRTVFVQQEFDSRNAEAIASETGTRLVRINPLSYRWQEEMIRVAQALSHE